MRHLTALLVCAGGLLTAGASQSEASLFGFGCFRPQTCCYGGHSTFYGGGHSTFYGGGHSSFYGGGHTSYYTPVTTYYTPVTTYYTPVTTYYAPTTNCCPTTACYAPASCCPTGTCGTSGCCPTTAYFAPACCPTNSCAACPGGNCGINCCPTGSGHTHSVSTQRATAPAQPVARPQSAPQATHFVSTPVVDSHWQPQPKVRTANLQRTIPAAAPSTGWEPVR